MGVVFIAILGGLLFGYDTAVILGRSRLCKNIWD